MNEKQSHNFLLYKQKGVRSPQQDKFDLRSPEFLPTQDTNRAKTAMSELKTQRLTPAESYGYIFKFNIINL
jgi:hypothetical protein